jgi:CubicO group peptidase (beta-lactamase class C family)
MYLRNMLAISAGLLAAASTASAQARPSPGEAASIDSVAKRLFALGASPGIGIVVVRDDRVVYATGLGFADVEARRPFTAETEFYIASTTKSFTGLASAILEQRGVWKLDAPLSRYLPSVRLTPPMNADSITIRSLLTHTHGIASGPVDTRLAYTGEYGGDAELTRLLSEHSPLAKGRAFEYSNLGYNIAALAMDAVTHEFWKETLQRLLFSPLGMSGTSAYVSRVPQDRLAMPYRAMPTGFVRAYFGKTDANMQSAGGLMTTPNDMGRWLLAHVNAGRLDGRQVLPAAAVAESHKLLAPVGIRQRGLEYAGYGLGWQIAIRRGDTLLVHGGGFQGFSTHMSFMPGRRVGVAVMANNAELGSGLADLLASAIYDVMLGGTGIGTDSLAAIRSQIDRTRSAMAAEYGRRAARPQSLPYPLDAYAGTFENPIWGHVTLSVVNGKLEARMGAAWSAVEVYDNTRNQLRVELFGAGNVVSVEMTENRASSLTLQGVSYRRSR